MIFWCLNQKEIILKLRLTQQAPASHVATATVFDVHPGNVRRSRPNLCKKTEVIVLNFARPGAVGGFRAEASFIKAVVSCPAHQRTDYLQRQEVGK
jgi:hypothetical protein